MKKQKTENKIVKDVKSFVVDRETWFRGKGPDNSCLANNANRLCCLGFYAEACGLDRKTIRNLHSPEVAVEATTGKEVLTKDCIHIHRKSNVIWQTKLVDRYGNDTGACRDLMTVNDDKSISDEDRESKLTALFKKLGIKVKFQ